MDISPIVQIKGLNKRLKNIQAVHELSMDVFEKDIFGFLGPNGSGKSTTIRLLLSLLVPDSGSIDIFGMALNQYRNKILRNIGAFVEKPDC